MRMLRVFCRDHGVEPAHDAGQGDRLHRIGDHQIFRSKFAVHAIERLERFPAESPAHQNFAAFEQIEIEDVGGMSHLPERVVGSVGGIIDGTLIHQIQAPSDRLPEKA